MTNQPIAQGLLYFVGLDFDIDPRPFLDNMVWADFILLYSKHLTSSVVTAVANNGLKLGVIFEVGTGNTLGGAQQAEKDIALFLRQMSTCQITPGPKSACFLTTDKDSAGFSPAQLSAAYAYYEGSSNTLLKEGWQTGGYNDGFMQERLIDMFADRLYYPWSAGAKGWNKTREFDLSGKWAITQGPTLSKGGQWPLPSRINQTIAGSLKAVEPFAFPDIGTPYDPDIAVNLDWAL